MEAIWILVGFIAGAGTTWLSLKSRLATSRRAEEEAARLRADNERLRIEAVSLAKDREFHEAKASWLDRARDVLEQSFKAVAGDVFRGKLDEADADMFRPLKQSLEKLEGHMHQLEVKREGAYGKLEEELSGIRKATADLQNVTVTLSQAMTSSSARGRWGELQLQRLVELAGMTNHVDFDAQVQTGEGRPDMIIHLPNGADLPVDSKAPMTAYLESLKAPDERSREERLQAHVGAVRDRVRELARKEYWKQFDPSPEFVLMFVPVEASLGAAFERDGNLLDFAMGQRVLPTTPVTFLALLKAVAYGWQQQELASNVAEIKKRGQELYERLIPFLRTLGGVGKGLNAAVDGYNKALGSLERQVLPPARDLGRLVVSREPLEETRKIEGRARGPAAPEIDEAERSSGTGTA